jgi:tRNA(Ile2)-agmatinylcytidine synthase
MTVIGLDDTDSRRRGMCTTYLAARVAERVADVGGRVTDRLLVRLNPAVPHKTRGNAALAIHTDLSPETAADITREELTEFAEIADERTSPGLVVAPVGPVGAEDAGDADAGVDNPPASVVEFAHDAVREFHDLADARALLADLDWLHEGWSGHPDTPAGRGCIGALAAVGAAWAFAEWTYEGIAYREFDRCGTERDIDDDSLFAAADAGYPAVWDTVDRGEGEAVCVPSAPGPILYGIRGDDPEAIRETMARIESEPVERRARYRTNQGTDAHLRDADAAGLGLEDLRDGRAYRVTGTVTTAPETRRGGHVFVGFGETAAGDDTGGDPDDLTATIDCAAFEPTKRFRDRVRALRPGDELTVCGEVSEGTLKLEKFAVRSLVTTERTTPLCPDCGNTMESAGRDQGYRCRDCGTTAPGTVERALERDLERGWYEVPPCARRHIAKPLVRGGFDAPTHPER